MAALLISSAGAGAFAALLKLRSKPSRKEDDKQQGEKGVLLLPTSSPATPLGQGNELVDTDSPSRYSEWQSPFSPGWQATGLTRRVLVAGTLVCLHDARGELLVVKEDKGGWVLLPVPAGVQGGHSLPFFPHSAIFSVVKGSNDLIGFRSLGADGRMLQAVKDPASPHRVHNYNFGPWESWALTPAGYVNQQWKKPLDFKIREVRAVATEDIRGFERLFSRSRRALEEQIQALKQQLKDGEDQKKDLQLAISSQQLEADSYLMRLNDAQQLCHKFRENAGHKGTLLSQLELRLCQLSNEKDELTSSLEKAVRQAASLDAELLTQKIRAEREAFLQEQRHAREIASIQKELDLAESVQAKCKQKEARMIHILDQLESGMALRSEEVEALNIERDRLELALQTIGGQVEGLSRLEQPLHSTVDAAKLRYLRRALDDVDSGEQAADALEAALMGEHDTREFRSYADPDIEAPTNSWPNLAHMFRTSPRFAPELSIFRSDDRSSSLSGKLGGHPLPSQCSPRLPPWSGKPSPEIPVQTTSDESFSSCKNA